MTLSVEGRRGSSFGMGLLRIGAAALALAVPLAATPASAEPFARPAAQDTLLIKDRHLDTPAQGRRRRAAAQRGRPGRRRRLAALPHRARPGSLQPRHGHIEGHRQRLPGAPGLRRLRRPGVQPLAARHRRRRLDPRRPHLGLAHRLRADRAQPAPARWRELPPPLPARHALLRAPRVPQQHAQHRPLRHHLRPQRQRVRAPLHEQAVDRRPRPPLRHRRAGRPLRRRQPARHRQGQRRPRHRGRQEHLRRAAAAAGAGRAS